MNILHVALSFAPGGRREAIRSLAVGLRKHQISSHLCALDSFSFGDDHYADCFDGTVQLRRHGLADRNALVALRHYCHDHAIDIVHSHDGASQFSCMLALPWRAPPLLMTFHRSLGFESHSLKDRTRNRIAGLRSSMIVTASRERRTHYLAENRLPEDKVICIPLGVDTMRFRPDPLQRVLIRSRLGIPADALLVGAAGHFGSEKGLDLAIDAFQHCQRSRSAVDAHLLILGQGHATREYALRARIDPVLAGKIHFIGFQNKPEHWFAALDVFLHGARQEAFGLVLAEAMACGVPVVAARVGGIPEVVRDGVTGLLVERADSTLLATTLARLLADSNWRESLGQAGIAHTHTALSSKRYVADHLALYRSLSA